MVYASQSTIEAVDYNNFAASVNALWGVGSGDRGYGQTSPANLTLVTQNVSTVTAQQWSDLLARMNTIDQHQTATTTGLTAPVAGNTINVIASLGTTIGTLDSSRLSTHSGGPTSSNTVPNTTNWVTSASKEALITFSNANAMRHFFNAGGYVQFTGKNSTLSGNTKSDDWDALLSAAGDIRITANGSSRIPGSGSPTITNANRGFYQQATTYANANIIVQQYSTTVSGGYNTNYVNFEARTDAAAGSSTILYVRMNLFDQATDDILPLATTDTVQGNVILTVTVVQPSTSYLPQVSWGTPTITAGTNTQA
jgi:hypothetical protein